MSMDTIPVQVPDQGELQKGIPDDGFFFHVVTHITKEEEGGVAKLWIAPVDPQKPFDRVEEDYTLQES